MSTDDKIQVEKENEDAPPQLEIEDPNKVLDSTTTQKDLNEENSEDEYTDDDDSEYTYETISDDDDDNNTKPKKKGWFGFLKRGKQTKQEDEGSISSSSSENEEEDIIAALDNHKQILSEEDNESNYTVSSDDGHGKHHLLNSPQTIHPTISSTSLNTTNKLNQQQQQEEERLMAQAVQRVQQRIKQSGGNLYEALDEHDKQLVDELKGVKDVKKIKEIVDKSIDAEFDSGGSKDREDGDMKEEPSVDVKPPIEDKEGPIEQQQEQSLLDNKSSSDEEYDDEESDEDEEPTIVEKQSLLSLAAEHDRVDVINELLTISEPSLNQFEHDLLLQGVSSVTTPNTMFLEGGRLEAIFIPPPLHVAVAHGSSNAASCLLRMRECDPSIRPQVPKQYLLGGYDDGRTSPSKGSSMNMKEDRNYKKYQDMSAWELAFGGTAVTTIVGDATQVEETEYKLEEEVPKRGSWFGFGSSSKIEEEPIKIESVIINGVSKQRRINSHTSPNFGGNAPLAMAAYEQLVARKEANGDEEEDTTTTTKKPYFEVHRPNPMSSIDSTTSTTNISEEELISNLQTSIQTSKIQFEILRNQHMNLELNSNIQSSNNYTSYAQNLQNNYLNTTQVAVEHQRHVVDGINGSRMEEQRVAIDKLHGMNVKYDNLVDKNRRLGIAVTNLEAEVSNLKKSVVGGNDDNVGVVKNVVEEDGDTVMGGE